MRAEILTIGDELCRGEIVNTNSSYFAARLWDLNITTRWMTSCNDDEADLASALTQAAGRADVVLCSGGLGPTEDDLTVDVLSRLIGVDPVVDEAAKAHMLERFGRMITGGQVADKPDERRARSSAEGAEKVDDKPDERRARSSAEGAAVDDKIEELTRIQLRQVRVPQGARVHRNAAGLAPGFEVALHGVPVICMPGIPREVFSIWDGGVSARLAELREARGRVERIARRIYRAFGRGESQVSQVCRGLVDHVPGASIHYQVKFPETLVKLVVRDLDQAAADARLEQLDAGVRERLRGVVYGTGETDTLVEKVTRRLIASGLTIATAESCTGGMIGELLTRLPGSSRSFYGGAIVYTNAEKVRQLGVSQVTLDAHGAVSEETVREMAAGARSRFGTDFAVSVSGIAGPDGGTPEKPVGTVWLALASDGDTVVKKIAWPGARDQVRLLSAWWALKLVDEALDRRGIA